MYMSFPRQLFVVSIFLVLLSAVGVSQQNAGSASVEQAVARAKASAIKAPRAIYTPNPEYSMDARKHHVQGTVILALTVDTDGRAKNIKVKRSLRPDLDQNAMDAVSHWKFEPATKDGNPVAVNINIEVNFRLYK